MGMKLKTVLKTASKAQAKGKNPLDAVANKAVGNKKKQKGAKGAFWKIIK